MKNAEIGIEELRNKVDSLIIIPNDKLCSDKDMPLSEAKNQSNAVLERAVGGIAELITKPGDINLDFADVRQVMLNAGSTMMGTGIGEGQDRAEDAIREAIASPILEDVNVEDAKGLLINITSNGSLTRTRISNNSPGRSTPSQKLFVPKSIPLLCWCIPLIIPGLEAPLV